MSVKAFPSAEGYGAAECVHGRGGIYYPVTNLNDSGVGSYRYGMETASGPRIVVPRIGGTVNLNSNVNVNNPYVYFAGQAAPGGGLLLKNYQTVIRTHNIAMRYLRSRCGLAAVTIPPGRDTNNFLVYAGSGAKYNIILDHCDSSWATDQNGPDVYAWAYNITIQWCAIGEGLVTGHSTGVPHNKGCILGSEPWMNGGTYPADAAQVLTLSFHHNYMHSLGDRCPLVSIYPRNGGYPMTAPVLRADIRNNLIYNWGGNNATKLQRQFYNESDYNGWTAGAGGNPAVEVNLIGNHYLNGPNTAGNQTIAWVMPEVKVFAANNIGPVEPGVPRDGFSAFISRSNNRWIGDTISPASSLYGTYDPVAGGNVASSEYTCPSIETVDATLVKALLTANLGSGAGCVLPSRDAVLNRWIAELNAGTGSTTINHSDYPTLAAGTAPTDTDGDGIPDAWASANLPGGATANDTAPNGYTYIENYLNELAGDIVITPPVNAFPAYIPMQKNTNYELVGASVVDPTLISVRLIGKQVTIDSVDDAGGAVVS